ncbi:flagellar motor switch protein FliN [bacterium]|nr:flagellar motor switch protein FliN [bacterium]
MTNENKETGSSQPEWFEPLGQWIESVSQELQLALKTLIDREVNLNLESPAAYTPDMVDKLFKDDPTVITVRFSEKNISGWHFLFQRAITAQIADLAMMGEGDTEFDESLHPSTLGEIWGQVVAALETEMTSLYGDELTVEMPEVVSDKAPVMELLGQGAVVRWNLQIGELEEGYILMVIEQGFAQLFIKESVENPAIETGEITEEMVETLTGTQDEASAPEPAPSETQPPVVKKPEFEDFGEQAKAKTVVSTEEQRNIDMLLDVSLPITIELGRTEMLIKDVLELGQGSIIELEKLSGEPVDLYVNDKKFARGEVVVIEENFGVRITELIKIDERLKALR